MAGVNICTLARMAVVVLVMAGCKARQPPDSKPKPLAPPQEKVTYPALAVGDDEGLTFAIDTTRTSDPAGRRIRLRLGGGEATLSLNAPATKSSHALFGEGTLQATNAAEGAPLVAAVAHWLGRAAPAAPAAPRVLRPFPISYARLGESGGWEANKLFLQNGSLEAEVYLNVRLDGKQARLVEKDEDYRRSQLALLAIAVRDGKPPRRMSGPEMAGKPPLVPSLSPIAGSRGVQQPQVWMGGVWISVLEDGAKQKVLAWSDLDTAPRQLAEVTGSVSKLVASPKRDSVAMLVLHPKTPGSPDSDDPGEVLVLRLDGKPAQ